LFTGDSGSAYGYADDWIDDGVFLYVGEGQIGDMQFVRGNKAIRDHAKNGKELLLFETLGKGKRVRFVGRFACANWEYRRGPDKEGEDRQIIAFHLISTEEEHFDDGALTGSETPPRTFEEMRHRAYEAATETPSGDTKSATRTYYQRSKAVKDYVLARAAGKCESCCLPAPFNRKNGEPYLEPHHTRRVSDAGPDHPRWVAAICPNCHREIHHGSTGEGKNAALIELLGSLEESPLK
jgi:5-methylcytosine-specific restriction protein A